MAKLSDYFAAKTNLYVQSVKGRFRRLKWILNIIFLTVFFVTPFIRFNRGTSVSNQAILLDLPGQKAYFFFIEIWPQEVYYFAGILIIAAVALFFITALFGRIWCGYACFQTVWTDIFIALERLFMGDRNQRIILNRHNNWQKFYKTFLTHCSWIAFSLLTGYGFVCYFNDAILLSKNLLSGVISFDVLGWILGIALSTYIMAGFAREHVCTYMCPYSRFQSAMFDAETLIIGYDSKRGEPRKKLTKEQGNDQTYGDCIDCKQCVVVCPMGIDIRNGLQMECIACGLCIDACDNIMEKINRPKGLIRYDTSKHIADPTAKKFRILRPATFYYAAILLAVSVAMLFSLLTKSTLEIKTISDRNPLFVKLADGSIRNGYTVKVTNKTHDEKHFLLSLSQPQGAKLKVQNQPCEQYQFSVIADSTVSFKLFVTATKELFVATSEQVIDLNLQEITSSKAEPSMVRKIKLVFASD